MCWKAMELFLLQPAGADPDLGKAYKKQDSPLSIMNTVTINLILCILLDELISPS